jgi:2-polyprenyl-3-methyl-5-hydroxy-6-metoxy-1,4-benzoquinol methylase
LSTTPTDLAADAVAYHASLANEWERRYRKPSFQMRQTVLLKSVEGRELAGTLWLDAGCGTGTLARWLATRGCSVIGVDAASEMVAAAQFVPNDDSSERLSFIRVQTIARLGLDDRSLDGILCSSVLEYVPDPSACLAEFARVLRPGGLLLVSVPNRNSLVRRLQRTCHELGGLFGHSWCRFLDYSRHQYSRPEFERLLTQAGFSGKKIVPFGSPLPRLAQRSRHWAPLLMFVAQKLA